MNSPLLLKCKSQSFNLNEQTIVMGILNVTPDSFSDGGRFTDVDIAVSQAIKLCDDGAKIIDIGGESTRPGFAVVSEEEELKRVLPIIKAVSQKVNVPISIDTYKAEVAKQAIEAGAEIINDIWGAKADAKMAMVAAYYQVPIILMHNRDNKNYGDLMQDIIADLQESIRIAKAAGVTDENIILDPGLGFAKTFEHQLEVMRNLHQIVALGYPVLLGTSRKSFIGQALDLPVDQRLEGTGATVCYGVSQGCQIVRVHDVRQMHRMVTMMDFMMGKRG